MPRQSVDRVKINLYFQNNILDGYKKLAKMRGTTYSELIREACRQYLVSEGGKVLQDTLTIKSLTE